MARKRRNDEPGEGPSGFDRVFAALDAAPAGLHDITPAAEQLPSGLPGALIELYARCDGMRLYVDSVELRPSAEVQPQGEQWIFGELEGEELLIDARGRIWRNDESLDDAICEGTRLDRWLGGIVDALGMLYDDDGEFADGVFDDDGEIVPAIGERQLRAMLKRDPGAPGPRWRLGHALIAQDHIADGRAAFEEAVAAEPGFAWAWLDLARV